MITQLDWRRWLRTTTFALTSTCLVACSSKSKASEPGGDEPVENLTSHTGARRLSLVEINHSLLDLLGDESRVAGSFLPADPRNPFDNDWDQQQPSVAFSEGADRLVRHLTERLLADPARLDSVVGCSPSGAADSDCMEEFIRGFGRRALRRPLTEVEVQQYLGLQGFGVEADDFYVGVETVLWAILQDPEFFYRVEIGTPVEGNEGLFRLNSYESVTRLSFWLLGTTPNDQLLDAAQLAEESGVSLTPSEMGQLAQELLSDPAARERAYHFHSQWMGFDVISNVGSLLDDMEQESRALIDRVLFDEDRPWTDLLTADETFVTDELAQHYGLPAPEGGEGWVAYGDSGRAGLLSHGSFLTVGARFDDSSPVQRGLVVLNRLLCQEIPPPPPNVNPDADFVEDPACKWDRYEPTRQPGCVGCHDLINPIGFGLEAYDRTGAFRDVDTYGCQISDYSTGEVAGLGSFTGPGELGILLAGSDDINTCLATHLYRYAVGRSELAAQDSAMVEVLLAAQPEGINYQQLIVDLASTSAFVHRKLEE